MRESVKKEIQFLIEMWRKHYNTVRPHSSLGHSPPCSGDDRWSTFSNSAIQSNIMTGILWGHANVNIAK